MKPTSPEDRDLEKMSAEVSAGYRAGAADEPSARLDAAILAVARREVERPRPQRHWQVPASVAAVLVIGVSLVLVVRDNETPLPSLGQPAADEAKLANSAPPQLAMKAQPKAKVDALREDRPSRERTARPLREPVLRDKAPLAPEGTASGTTMQPAAVPVVVEPAKSAAQVAGIAPSPRLDAQALRKEKGEASTPVQPQDWLGKIDDLLRDGKESDAREQLLDFRKQFPNYPLSQRFQALLPQEPR
ncbi:MAG: hypothetical protein ABI728_15735 [Betaproteobacteria bacterium]